MKGGTAPKPKSNKGGGGKKRQPMALSNQERAAIDTANKNLQGAQQGFQPVPNGPTCDSCAGKGRNPHHHYLSCAFFLCHYCKRGGHRVIACPF